MSKKPEKQFELSAVSSKIYLFLAAIMLVPVLLIAVMWMLNPNEFSNTPPWLWPVVLLLGPIIIIISMKGIFTRFS